MSEDRKRKVAICGTAPSSLPLAPFGDPEWEIWGTSRLWQQLEADGIEWDVWFELHPLDEIGRGWNCTKEQRKAQRSQHLEWMAEQNRPIYLQEEHPDRVPSGIAYPLEEVCEFTETEFRDTEDYFTNTIAYMIALAIYQQVDEIGVYGVDMALGSEYGSQRPSCEYWIGLARGYGIPTVVPTQADLLKCPFLYGFESEDRDAFMDKIEARRRELQQRKQSSESRAEQLKLQRAQVVGKADMAAQIRERIGEVAENGTAEAVEGEMSEVLETCQQTVDDIEAGIEQAKKQATVMKGALQNMDYIDQSWSGID